MSEKDYIWNPKVKGSGIITCIPQTGVCPNKCEDCFFQSGRSYLEPLKENLPHLPPVKLTRNRIVRINDGNDSNVERQTVEHTASKYQMYFFNTALSEDLEGFSAPVVMTVNPGNLTDKFPFRIDPIPDNLMFVRVRTNMWNLLEVVWPAVEYYTKRGVVVVLTFMAYYTERISKEFEHCYEWKKRTLNSYWVLKQKYVDNIMGVAEKNPHVYSCGIKGRYECMFCGNCVREYFNAMDRLRGVSKRIII